MKIMKHSKDAYPVAVTGVLLGLDLDGTLEVSNSFPLPAPGDDEERAARSCAHYTTFAQQPLC